VAAEDVAEKDVAAEDVAEKDVAEKDLAAEGDAISKRHSDIRTVVIVVYK